MKKKFTNYKGALMLAFLSSGFVANAQQITTPSNTPLSIQTFVDVVGGLNIKQDSAFKIGGKNILLTKGSTNLMIGEGAGPTASFGAGASNNSLVGASAGNSITTGAYNTFVGPSAGNKNTTGGFNIFLGPSAGFKNLGGSNNSYIGTNAGVNSTAGDANSFIGVNAGFNSTGSYNTFIGSYSGTNNTSGGGNVAIGINAGLSNATGANNTFIGTNAGASIDALTNTTAIGYNASATASNTVVLGSGATTITGQGLGAGLSGLKFANLSSGSAATPVGGNKVLSVDATGNVVLVTLTAGTINSVGGPTGPVSDAVINTKAVDNQIKDLDARLTKISNEKNTWKEDNGFLYNNSTKGVVINGTGFDGQALVVKGKMLSEEVNVKVQNSDWPDYVFKPSYKRMTLDEVEKFININGHLPNVASATEMAATGNNLNKTDIKLLEKVEELTLYLLEMKKSNEAQNAEIQNLKKQVKSLRRK
jgi:trimeric autotransporter adhesin